MWRSHDDGEYSRNHQEGYSGLCCARGPLTEGDIRALCAKFDALHAEFGASHSEFDSLRSESRSNQQALMAALQNGVLRGEIATQREISDLRERVTRIEDQLRTLTQ